ncbi:MAG: hypothetical protein EOM24_02365 [Chloroflexia bacterium]|nr:hypothetical protein [Chloroflexia bacterium]
MWQEITGEKTRNTSKWAGFFYWVAAIFAAVTGLVYGGIEGLGSILVLAVVYATLGSAGDLFSGRRKKLVQVKRNELTLAIHADLQAGRCVPEYFVYLRPLTIDRNTIQNPDRSTFILLPSSLRAENEKYEEWFADLIANVGALVSLGFLDKSLGAGALETDEDHWLEIVCNLMEDSCGIFIVPGHQKGILDEIRAITQNHWLGKTVFMQPLLNRAEQKVFKNYWNNTRKIIAEDLRLDIPPFSKKGSLFSLHDDGSLKGVTPLPGLQMDDRDFFAALELIGIEKPPCGKREQDNSQKAKLPDTVA